MIHRQIGIVTPSEVYQPGQEMLAVESASTSKHIQHVHRKDTNRLTRVKISIWNFTKHKKHIGICVHQLHRLQRLNAGFYKRKRCDIIVILTFRANDVCTALVLSRQSTQFTLNTPFCCLWIITYHGTMLLWDNIDTSVTEMKWGILE